MKKKAINDLTIRLQRFRLRLTRFDFDIEHVAGKKFYIPDTLSRRPLSYGTDDVDILDEEEDITYHINIIHTDLEESFHITEKKIKQSQTRELEKLIEYTGKGWPNKEEVTEECKKFFKYRNDITIYRDILYYKDRFVIPTSMYKEMLNKIHIGHQGIGSCKKRARKSIWWPNINIFIEDHVEKCHDCIKNSKQETEPMTLRKLSNFPWDHVATDLFIYKNKTFLVIQDIYSKYPIVKQLSKTKSEDVIKILKDTFSQFGIPNIVYSDGGPQFSSYEFQRFTQKYNFDHVMSSPRYPRSNGQAERAVQLVKQLMKKCDDWYLGLLAYRNTELPCGNSPAQLLFGRQLKEILPIRSKNLYPELPNHEEVRNYNKMEQENQKKFYDRRHRARPLPSLEPGDMVWIRDMRRKAEVIDKAKEPNSYWLESGEGELRRTRNSLNKLPERDECILQQEDVRNSLNKLPEGDEREKEEKEKDVRQDSSKANEQNEKNNKSDNSSRLEERNKVNQQAENTTLNQTEGQSMELRRSKRSVKKPKRYRND